MSEEGKKWYLPRGEVDPVVWNPPTSRNHIEAKT
jgi:hypothetical protein